MFLNHAILIHVCILDSRKKKDPVLTSKKDVPASKKEIGAGKKKLLSKKLPAVPESVLKRRKKRDAKKAAKLKVSIKVS